MSYKQAPLLCRPLLDLGEHLYPPNQHVSCECNTSNAIRKLRLSPEMLINVLEYDATYMVNSLRKTSVRIENLSSSPSLQANYIHLIYSLCTQPSPCPPAGEILLPKKC